MIDEKKLANAAMNEEELDQVAGGTFGEIKDDAHKLQAAFGHTVRFAHRTGIGKMEYIDEAALRDGFKRFGVQVNFDDNKPNEYFIDGNKVTREEAWNHINSIVDKIPG